MATTAVIPCSIVLEVLNEQNYEHWSFLVRTYLRGNDLWDVIADEPPKPEDCEVRLKSWREKDAKALHALAISCGSNAFSVIRDADTAKSAWEALQIEFTAATASVSEGKVDPSHSGEIEEWDEDHESAKASEEGVIEELGMDSELAEASEQDMTASENNRKKLVYGFFIFVQRDDWCNAKECLNRLEDFKVALVAKDPRDKSGDTALHVAAKLGYTNIVKELVMLMVESPETLEVENAAGYTALGSATSIGCEEAKLIEMVRYMVDKNKNILSTGIPPKNSIPVVEACGWDRWELANYLYSVTPKDPEIWEGHNGAQLLIYCFRHMKGLDIACDLIERFPKLAIAANCEGHYPMELLAGMSYASPSAMRLRFWQTLIYRGVHIEPVTRNSSIYVLQQEGYQGNQNDKDLIQEEGYQGNQEKNLIHSDQSLLKGLVKALPKFLGINQIYENKFIHARILEVIQHMGKTTKEENLTEPQQKMVNKSIFRAIEQGHVEFVTEMFKVNPDLLYAEDHEQMSIYQYAIKCRQENIYNLIYDLKVERRKNLGVTLSKYGNNMLHMAGTLSPIRRFEDTQSAALQIQKELQWFKEVEKIVPPNVREFRNDDNLTARELFISSHEKIMEAAASSMKATATSCTTIGALIVTIMFAVAFTAPGGHNQDTGYPVFTDKPVFKVFLTSDIISLISSTTSVITFLGILTSGYAVDDFIKTLPTTMMVGLLTLLLSIASMMVTFTSALIIMHKDRISWMVILSIVLASIPVASFVLMHFALIMKTFKCTYGAGIFKRNSTPSI